MLGVDLLFINQNWLLLNRRGAYMKSISIEKCITAWRRPWVGNGIFYFNPILCAFPIQLSVISHRCYQSSSAGPHSSCTVNRSNFLKIPMQRFPLITVSDSKPVRLTLLNMSSLKNKTFLLFNQIAKHELDFTFLTETWLGAGGGLPSKLYLLSKGKA